MHRPFSHCTVLIAVLAIIPLLSMCRRSGDTTFSDDADYADTLTHHARLLTIADTGHGTVRVDIGAPDSETPVARFALVHNDSVIPDGIAADIKIIRTPVSSAAVFSSVHTGALNELDALDALSAIADADYLSSTDTVAALVASGKVMAVGPSQSPSAERLASSMAQIVLSTPHDGMTMPKLPENMTVIPCTDYLENSPIARAEWILLFGELFDKRDEARRIFTDVIDEYTDLCYKASGATSPSPKVLTEAETSGVWYVPAGHSYMARMLADAGAEYPWADTDGTGSLPLSLETVAEKAIDADIW
ncbi:MAG: ABC transporter substrate-binding protein, partial [Muribaculaceae bacterium]|nr:ABC transporter substrate-binding protein [Muribaculaceae bacterium]